MSGGGNVSAMGAVAAGARARGGRTVGVIPKALVHRELADVDADELIVTDTMRQRKQIMEDRADAFITLPGGIGTLEELFETWTAGYLGMHDKPVVMLDPDGHYDGLRTWLDGLVDTGYVSPAALDRLLVVRDVDAALDLCGPVRDRGHSQLGCPHVVTTGSRDVRWPARHRQPVARRADGRAGDPARRDHRVSGPPDVQDLDRQGVPGPGRAATATGRSSSSATRR